MMVRLEGNRLLIEREGLPDVSLVSNYELGRKVDLKIEASAGHVNVWFDGMQKLNWPVSREGCYFKTGCYIQSNTSTGDDPEAYGEVVIYKLKTMHVAAK